MTAAIQILSLPFLLSYSLARINYVQTFAKPEFVSPLWGQKRRVGTEHVDVLFFSLPAKLSSSIPLDSLFFSQSECGENSLELSDILSISNGAHCFYFPTPSLGLFSVLLISAKVKSCPQPSKVPFSSLLFLSLSKINWKNTTLKRRLTISADRIFVRGWKITRTQVPDTHACHM